MFKNTKAFELITLLEQMLIKNRLKNSLLFIIKFEIHNFIMKRFVIRKGLSPEKKMNLFKELFKEYFDIYNKLETENIKTNVGHMTYDLSNNKIDCIISYNTLIFYILYDLSTDYFTLHIKTGSRGVNIDERNLQMDYINNIAYDSLMILFTDIMTKLLNIFVHNTKINKDMYSKREEDNHV